jgi:D-sedoheptulose 7-phosphate isomerase
MKHIKTTLERYPQLTACENEMEKTVNILLETYRQGGKILLCGNGGSAADCEHIAGELLKGFLSKRTVQKETYPALNDQAREKLQSGVPAIPLPSFTGVNSAFANDVDGDWVYAQLTFALAKPVDVLVCLSTSGNSKNVVLAAETAKAIGVKTIALTGAKESKLSSLCDVAIRVPETETYKVQELHLPVYHALCAEIEDILFS